MNRKPILLTAAIAACLIVVLGISRSRAQQRQELDPVKMMPQYNKVILENAIVRVTEERMPPGVGIGKHFHQRGITINMGNFQMEQKMYPGGEIVHSDRHMGEIHWNDSMTHETKNVGTTPQWTVRVEVKGGL
jgi:hypothetical protein